MGRRGQTHISSSDATETISSTPGMRIVPSVATSLLMSWMRSVMGSCTARPNAPECKSRAGPDTISLKYARPRRPYVRHGVRVFSQ